MVKNIKGFIHDCLLFRTDDKEFKKIGKVQFRLEVQDMKEIKAWQTSDGSVYGEKEDAEKMKEEFDGKTTE